jgi:alkanesulfonate monooxygenase SsuD/methylene tetrahydromethanopterin reductase-like flavin-dependent oxidoreductase (luciferase family)
MSDYGLSVQFGVSVTPDASDLEQITALVDTADQTGLDLVAVQDHAYNPQFLDTWTLLAFLAARTERVRFFPDVADLALRPPAMLAKAAASLDRLSGGRIELGLGSGAFWDQIAAMGGPRRTPGEAVASTEEAMQIARLAWSTAPSVSFAGRHYQFQGYQPGPPPAHSIGIWLGAVRPQMLRLSGRLADGWVCPLNVYVPPEQVPASQAIIDQAAQDAGRAPAEIRRIYNVLGAIDAGPHGGRGLIVSKCSRAGNPALPNVIPRGSWCAVRVSSADSGVIAWPESVRRYSSRGGWSL